MLAAFVCFYSPACSNAAASIWVCVLCRNWKVHDRLDDGMQHLDWFYNGTLATHMFCECAVCGGNVCRVRDDWHNSLCTSLTLQVGL